MKDMTDIEKIKDNLAMLDGDPPHNTWTNIYYDDGYFARSLEKKYGKTIAELRKLVGK